MRREAAPATVWGARPELQAQFENEDRNGRSVHQKCRGAPSKRSSRCSPTRKRRASRRSTGKSSASASAEAGQLPDLCGEGQGPACHLGALDYFRAETTAGSAAAARGARRALGLGWHRLRPVGFAPGLPTERKRTTEHLERTVRGERAPDRPAVNLRAGPQAGPLPMPMDALHAPESKTPEAS